MKQIKRELRLTRSDPDKVSTSMAPRAPRNLHGCGLIAVQSEPLPRGQTGRIGGDPVHRALLASTGDRIWKAMPHQAMPHHMMAFSEVSKMCPVALGQRAKIPIHSDKCAMSMSESYAELIPGSFCRAMSASHKHQSRIVLAESMNHAHWGTATRPVRGAAVAGTVVSIVPEFTLPPPSSNGGSPASDGDALMHGAQTTAIVRAQMASSDSREHLY